jgi:hypothetical protein
MAQLRDEGRLTWAQAYLRGVGWIAIVVGSVWGVRALNHLYDRLFKSGANGGAA